MRKIWVMLMMPFVVMSQQLKGISIYGLETPLKDFTCSWVHPVEFYISKAKELGFNNLRLPFSIQYIQEGNLEKLDQFVETACAHDMTVILDCHRVVSDFQGPDPFHALGMNVDKFVDMWKSVLGRYVDKKNVIGHNIYNEYQGTDVEFLKDYSRKVINAVELEFGSRYNHYVTGTVWSGNLAGVSLEDMPCHDRIFYSCHKYPFSGTADEKDWLASFANVGLPTEKVIIGEFGWKGEVQSERDWAVRFIDFLRQKNITNTIYWTIANSHDTGNLYEDNCEYIHWDNFEVLKTLWETRYLRTR